MKIRRKKHIFFAFISFLAKIASRMKVSTTIFSRLSRLFCLVLALHFLNVSIDSPDRNPDTVPEDLSFNDIESVTELFAELVFGFTNAFEEHDEDDAEDGSSSGAIKFYFNNYVVAVIRSTHDVSGDNKFALENYLPFPSRSPEVNSPPPEV